ncbi:Nuclear control of ATPase protein 2, partial [Auxenochlorella protothecoides]
EAALAEVWLAALQLSQVAFSRVLAELDDATANLTFWEGRVKQEHHFWFIWLQQGPGAFLHRSAQLLRLKEVQAGGLSSAELMEKRVLVFRLLRDSLCRSLACIQSAAELLLLTSHVRQEPGGNGEERSLFQAADAAVERCMTDISKALSDLTVDMASILGADAAAAAEVADPAARRDHVLHAALSKAARDAIAASAALSSSERLVHVPRWARMPSELQRHWVKYGVVWALAGAGALFVVRHSPLAGSSDLQRWWSAGVGATRAALDAHLLAPLQAVRDELFTTFRSRPSIVSLAEYEADRDSLARMLGDFERDRGLLEGRNVEDGDARLMPAPRGGGPPPKGMDTMMRRYEHELKKPIRNLVAGDLARCLLIQASKDWGGRVQKLKVDSESAMLEIDQILKSNELSIALVAAVPAFLIAGGLLYWTSRLITPAPPDPKTEAVPARLALVEAERSLAVLATPEPGRDLAQAAGLYAFQLAAAYEEARSLFARHRGLFGGQASSEWPALQAELKELGAPGPVARKLGGLQRIMRAYSIYQQF